MNTSNHIPSDVVALKELADTSRTINLGGKLYYEISPYHNYWIDDGNREFKESLALWAGYRVEGNFNPSLFVKALSYLTGRHESLRSTFLSMEDKYYITSEENNGFSEQTFGHSLMLDAGDEKDMLNWIYFKDHTFDIRKGPLFQVRIARKEKAIFLLSVKIHHAILDSWSWDILMRDLLTAYKAFEMGRLPDLPPLSFQYKDWLGWKRHLIERNYHAQKHHWQSLFKGLPNRLLLPGAKINNKPLPCRKGKKEYFYPSVETMSRFQDLCRKYHANFSLMFQALFMLYLSKLTGQEDIMIGTMVTGRSTISSQVDQIGFYAYTDLSRILFKREDSLREAVTKVEKSFKDMHMYNDYTLLMALSDMNPPGKTPSVPFWNANLDFASGASNNTPLSRDQSFTNTLFDRLPSSDTMTLTDMDLKLKIVNSRDKIEIRVLYDCELYDSPAITSLITGYLGYIDKQWS